MPINLPPGVSLHPNSSTRNRVQPTGDFIPFSVRAAVGQTTDLFVAYASDGTTKEMRVLADGSVSTLARLGVGTASFTDPLTGGTDLVQMTDGMNTWGFDANSNQPILSLTIGSQKAIVGHCHPADGAVFGSFSNHGLTLRAFGNQNCLQFQTGGLAFLGLGASLPSAQAQLHVRVVNSSTIGMLLQGVSAQAQPLLQLGGISSTGDVRYMGIVDATWADSTDATRKGRLTLQAADSGTGTTGREGLRIESSGTAAMLGFLGAAAVVQQPSTADLKDAWCGFGFQVNGGATPLNLDGGSMTAANYATAIATKTANYAMVATDGTIYADATSGAFSVTLPTPIGVAGRVYTVKKIDTGSNVVTVLPNGIETLDGSASVALAIPETTLGFQSDNANWRIV